MVFVRDVPHARHTLTGNGNLDGNRLVPAFQVIVIPVSVASIPYAQIIQQQLAEADYEVTNSCNLRLHNFACMHPLFKVRADLTCVGSLNRRIKNAIITKCNFILVVGMNEALNGTVNVRTRNDIVWHFKSIFRMTFSSPFSRKKSVES